MNPIRPGDLYADHIATLQQRAATALERGGFDHLVVPSGTLHYQVFDDRDYPYAVNPQFKAWLPVTDAPGSWLVFTPGMKPKLVFLQPRDYWHVVPAAPGGYWVEHFDIVVIREPDEARKHLQWATEHAKEDEMRDVARLRLAGVLLDEKKYDEALKVLSAKSGEGYTMLFSDLRGDVLTAQGKPAEARAAYQAALDKADPGSAYRRLIEVKLDALGEAK